MLYKFAMTPDLFDASVVDSDHAGTILVQLLRGIEENGLLADLHKGKWSSHIHHRLDTLAPALKDKVKTCLNVLDNRHRLVRHPKCMSGDPQGDKDWLNLAFHSHDLIPFHAILLSRRLLYDCGRENDSLVEFYSALDSEKWLARRRRTPTVQKTFQAYASELKPVLRHAKTLALVDPWMNSQESRYFDTLGICSKLLGQRGHARLKGRIYIHAEFKNQKPYGKKLPEVLSGWEEKLRPLVAADGHRFRVFLWESLPGSESMHDRFFLTDQCGISVPGGLDCRSHSHANTTDWSLLDEEVRLRRWNEYDPQASLFKLLGDVEIA